MKKILKSVACVLSVVMLFSVAGMVSPKLMPLGPDVVSAASEENSTSTSEESTTTTESATTSQATNVLKVGAKGDAVKNLQTMLNNFGYNLEVDGYFGNLTSEAVKDFQSKNGLTTDGIVGPKTYEVLEAGIESTDSTTKEEVATNDSALRLGKVDYAAHGNKSFAVVVVALAGDKIQDAYIDEFQFMSTDVATGVPNSDGDFGANYADPTVVLASKRVNTEYYSEHMKEEAGATTPLHKSYDAIQTHVKGMTITQLEEELSVNTSEGMVDVVSGATLRDTAGYLQAILAAAKNASENAPIQVDSTVLSNLELGKVNYAAHGNKSFAVTVAAVSGDQIVGAYIDEYQFMSTDVATGVPNSD
uniref:peptidoglycan-binding domain-containing protein n=1 Tax=Sporosalibacterium faouarense TaxID=516123 RepID=UPI00192CA42A